LGLIRVVEYIWLEGVREEYEQVREVRGVSTGGGRAYMYFMEGFYAQIQRGAYMHWREGYI
jgi:hypothetical protein